MMTKTFDYDRKGDQRITIKFSKLFSTISVFVDTDEVFRFPNKKDVSYGNEFKVGNDMIYVRYDQSEDNFEVKVNGIHDLHSANHPAKFLKSLAIGPFIYAAIGLIFLIVTISQLLSSSVVINDPLEITFYSTVVLIRIGIGVGLVKRIPSFYVFGFIWITLECLVSFAYYTLLKDDGVFMAIFVVFFKSLIFFHFIRNQKKYQNLRSIKDSQKKHSDNILDQ